MDIDTWLPFLRCWSEERFSTHPVMPRSAFRVPITSGWLGHAPTSKEELDAAEARLGRALPPSLPAVHLVSNG
ncbi:hypothetical protein ACFXJ8_31600 [Nonomuraea sp. NPDC059194]|uniref:hypothetical protein n=1 Tax=Nonomuraea sp. NPDC059194 TaxID=3346764 RepID=UPI003682C4FC